MARKRNPRRIALSMIRAIRADLAVATDRWAISGRVYVDREDRTDPAVWWRRRAAHEWPEHGAAHWQVLEREARQLADQAETLRAFAAEQIDRLTCTGCGKHIPATRAAAGHDTCDSCPGSPSGQ